MPNRQSSRERTREAARMIPGLNVSLEARDAARRYEQQQNSRVDPAVQAQRDAARRIAGLQGMHERLMSEGNQGEADQVMAIIQGLQEQGLRAQGPGAVMGDAVGRMSGQVARQRNAFAGMGSAVDPAQNRQGARAPIRR